MLFLHTSSRFYAQCVATRPAIRYLFSGIVLIGIWYVWDHFIQTPLSRACYIQHQEIESLHERAIRLEQTLTSEKKYAEAVNASKKKIHSYTQGLSSDACFQLLVSTVIQTAARYHMDLLGYHIDQQHKDSSQRMAFFEFVGKDFRALLSFLSHTYPHDVFSLASLKLARQHDACFSLAVTLHMASV